MLLCPQLKLTVVCVQMAELQEQIEAVGKESQRQIELADKRKMLKSELRRLEDENSMQRDRITQMEHDLRVSAETHSWPSR